MRKLIKFLKDYKLPLLVIAGFIYINFFRSGFPDKIIKESDFIIGLVVLGYFIYQAEETRLKAESPHLIGMGLVSSLGSLPEPFSDSGIQYYLFRLGGYKADILGQGFFQAGSEGCVIVPKEYTDQYSESFVFKSFKFEVKLDELPAEAQNIVQRNNIPPPYYDASIGIGVSDVEILPTLDIVTSIRATLSALREVVKDRMDIVKPIAGLASNIANSFQPKKQTLLPWPGGKD
jgi:hypothetical protein